MKFVIRTKSRDDSTWRCRACGDQSNTTSIVQTAPFSSIETDCWQYHLSSGELAPAPVANEQGNAEVYCVPMVSVGLLAFHW
jgi:hypothetical protein